MSARVDEDEIRHFLTWGRNYGELASYRSLPVPRRRWSITLPGERPITASGMDPGLIERSVIPVEFVLTSREALAFGYGLAIAGAREETRAVYATREWGW
jgi:hypothetical protein